MLVVFLLFMNFEIFVLSQKDDAYFRLRDFIMKSENLVSGPGFSKSFKVGFEMSVLNIDFDAKVQTVTGDFVFFLNWTEDSISWDKNDFDNIDRLQLSADEIWHPDFYADAQSVKNLSKDFISISANGSIFWKSVRQLHKACSSSTFDLYPFHSHLCQFTFSAHPNYVLLTSKKTLDNKKLTYDLFDAHLITTCSNGDGNIPPCQAQLSFGIAPRIQHHIFTLIIPSIFISIITTILYCVHSGSYVKLALALGLAVACNGVIDSISQKLPDNLMTLPFLLIYLVILLVLNGISTVITIIVVDIYWKGPTLHPPEWIQRLFLEKLSRLFGLETSIPSQDGSDRNQLMNRQFELLNELGIGEDFIKSAQLLAITHELEKQNEIKSNQWKKVAIVIDRCMFWLYFIIITLISVSLTVIMVAK